MELELKYKILKESLQLLALPYEDQVKCLPKFVEVQDEVSGLFIDAFLLLPVLIENDFLSKKSIISILKCYNLIDFAIRNENTATLEAFKTNTMWSNIRCLANESLEHMGEPKNKPNLNHVKWIN